MSNRSISLYNDSLKNYSRILLNRIIDLISGLSRFTKSSSSVVLRDEDPFLLLDGSGLDKNYSKSFFVKSFFTSLRLTVQGC